jgi:hypothetical protein
MKDVVIGCITNYTFENIKLFVNSIDISGFTGHKVMIVYNVPFSTVNELKKTENKELIHKEVLAPMLKNFTDKIFPYVSLLFIMYSLNLILIIIILVLLILHKK